MVLLLRNSEGVCLPPVLIQHLGEVIRDNLLRDKGNEAEREGLGSGQSRFWVRSRVFCVPVKVLFALSDG